MATLRTATKRPSAPSRAALLESQRRVLARIADGAPLADTLETLVRLIEEQAQGMRCAVLLADSDQRQLRFVAAPSVPEDFKRAIEPYLRIAPDMASCGTAAFLRQPVYTRDTAADPLPDNCRRIALRNGLRAVWSTPILSDTNSVLGTFAMYYSEPRLPAKGHIQLIDMATQLARLAIETKCDEQMLRGVFEEAPNGILIADLAGVVLGVNRTFAGMLGYTPSELHRKNVADIVEEEDYRALIQELLSGGRDAVTSARRYRGKSRVVLLAREHSVLRRDSTGRPRYVFSYVEKMIEAGRDLLEHLSGREREVLEAVIKGRSSKEIAARLGISAASVDTYRSRIMKKLHINDLPGLVRFAIRQGIASI